jgi:hypothetical protein
MPVPTKYWYWQPFPYQSCYYAFMRFSDYHTLGLKSQIAIVRRVNSAKWKATNAADPTALAHGKTRDAAIDALLEQIGGLG